MLTDFRGGIFSPNIKDLVDAVFLLTFYAFIRSVKFTTSHITQIEIFHFMIWQFILFTKIYVLSVLNVGVGVGGGCSIFAACTYPHPFVPFNLWQKMKLRSASSLLPNSHWRNRGLSRKLTSSRKPALCHENTLRPPNRLHQGFWGYCDPKNK